MIIFKDNKGTWVAWGKGYLRPIIAEGATRKEAWNGYAELYEQQRVDEEAFFQSMSSCIEMEEYTFITEEVQAALANTVPLQADVTKNDAEDKELLDRFGVFGPPTIIFFDESGTQLEGYEVVGFMNAEKFSAHLRQAFGS